MVTRQQIATCLAAVLVCLVCQTHAFAGRQRSQPRGVSLYGQAEDNAAILTGFGVEQLTVTASCSVQACTSCD